MVGREQGEVTISVVFSTVHEVVREQGVLTISVVVGREQGEVTISVVFSTVHEVVREQGVLTISVVLSTVHEVGREQGVLTIPEYALSQVRMCLLTEFLSLSLRDNFQSNTVKYNSWVCMSKRSDSTQSLSEYIRIKHPFTSTEDALNYQIQNKHSSNALHIYR